MTAELRKHKASRFEEKLRYPSYGITLTMKNSSAGR